MKKQILFLAMFTMALIFAGNIKVYGQATLGSNPRGTACVDDELHPIAGKPYTYTLDGNPAGGNFLWWATKDPTFVSTDAAGVRTYNNDATNLLTVAGGDLISTSANYMVAGASNAVTITWSDALLSNTVYNTNPTFLTTLYNNVICADNLKVYQLDPVKAFTVDILNYDGTTPLAYDIADDQCIDIVSSAFFNGTAMEYLYGQNIFVYEVIAANFTDSYTPIFDLTGLTASLNAVQTYTLEWTYDAPSTWNASTVFVDYVANPATTVTVAPTTDTSLGVSIYVRLTVTNNNFEDNATDNPTGLTFTLAVDGLNSVGDYDVNNGDGTLCDNTTITAPDMVDTADQTLLPRPSLIEGTISPVVPNIELIPGNEQN
jgi:hypothetical protein